MKKHTSARRAPKTERADLYQQVTDKIVAALEKGTAPWRKPWRAAQKRAGNCLPANATTGKAYSGINIPLLWMAAEERGFSSDRWLTLPAMRCRYTATPYNRAFSCFWQAQPGCSSR